MKNVIWKNIAQTAAAILFLLTLWLLAYLIAGNELLVPAFSDCAKETWGLWTSFVFWKGFLFTLLRAFSAFLISLVVASVFAVISYMLPVCRGIFAPIVSAFRSLPVLAVMLILLSVFSAAQAPVVVAFLSLFPILYTGILAALLGIDRQLIDMARVYGTPWYRRIFGVYLPLSAPHLLQELGGAISFSLKLVVSAEVLAHTANSLGGLMQEAKIYTEIARLFSLVGGAFVAGLLLELLFSALAIFAEKRVK